MLERDVIIRGLRWGEYLKAVFVRDAYVRVVRADSDVSRRLEAGASGWSLVGVFTRDADIDVIEENIQTERREQRDLARAMRNYDVRA